MFKIEVKILEEKGVKEQCNGGERREKGPEYYDAQNGGRE